MGNICKPKYYNNQKHVRFGNTHFNNFDKQTNLYESYDYQEYEDIDLKEKIYNLESKLLILTKENTKLKKDILNITSLTNVHNKDLDTLLNNDKYLYAKINWLEKELKNNNININSERNMSEFVNKSFLLSSSMNNLEYDDNYYDEYYDNSVTSSNL